MFDQRINSARCSRLPRGVYARWLAPHATEPSARGRELAVNGFLVGGVVLGAVAGLALLASLGGGNIGPVPAIFRLSLVVAWLGACLVLLRWSRGGQVERAAIGLLTGCGVAATALAAVWSIALPVTFLMIALYVVVAVLALHGRRTWIALAFLAAALAVLQLLQLAGVLTPNTAWRAGGFNVLDGLIMFTVLAVLAGVALLLRRHAPSPVDAADRPDPRPEPVRRRTIDLTPRELEVTELVSDGLSNDAIAAVLVVSPRTVHAHVASALRKTGCENRTALGVLAVREGIRPLLAVCEADANPAEMQPEPTNR